MVSLRGVRVALLCDDHRLLYLLERQEGQEESRHVAEGSESSAAEEEIRIVLAAIMATEGYGNDFGELGTECGMRPDGALNTDWYFSL